MKVNLESDVRINRGPSPYNRGTTLPQFTKEMPLTSFRLDRVLFLEMNSSKNSSSRQSNEIKKDNVLKSRGYLSLAKEPCTTEYFHA